MLACFYFCPKHLINSLLIKDTHSVCWKMPRGYWIFTKIWMLWFDVTHPFIYCLCTFFWNRNLEDFIKRRNYVSLVKLAAICTLFKERSQKLVKGTLLILNIDIMVVKYVALLYSFAFLPTNSFIFFKISEFSIYILIIKSLKL